MNDAGFAALVSLAEERMRNLRIPGVALGVADPEGERVAGLGVTDVDHPRPVGADTVFSIASITKTFTATTLVALRERGELDLDAPVRSYAPEFTLDDREAARRVTLRHLLTHTGGWIGEMLPEDTDGEDALARASAWCGAMRQVTVPGELFSYNNVGFVVAGRVIEAVTRRRYEEVVAERILGPLAMARSSFIPRADDDVAAEHTVRDGRPAVAAPWLVSRSGWPSGGLHSTARDLLRYARGHLGVELLSARAAAEMLSPLVSDGSRDGSQGLGWVITGGGSARVAAHGGATVTHMSTLCLVPQRRVALVVLTNGALGAQLCRDVQVAALRDIAGVAAPPEPMTRALPDARLAPYAGRYEWPTSDLELAPDAGGLSLRLTWKGRVAERPPMPPVRLEFWDVDRALCVDGWAKGAYADFPQPGLFRWSGRARPRVA